MISRVNTNISSTQMECSGRQAPVHKKVSGTLAQKMHVPAPPLAFQSRLNRVCFSGIQSVAKQIEALRDKNIDHEGIVRNEQLPDMAITKLKISDAEKIQPIVDLTKTNLQIKPFSEKEFNHYKPHYIVQTPEGYEGMFKFSLMDGDICREVGARYLAKMTGFDDVVPETMWVKINTPDYGERVGSLQKMVPNGKCVMDDHSRIKKVKESSQAMKDLRGVTLFNYIANNIDTGLGNWLVSLTEEGTRVRSIDHGLTGAHGAMLKGIPETFPELKTIKLNDQERSGLQAFVDNKSRYQPVLERFYTPQAVERIYATVEKLLDKDSVKIG